MGRAAGSESVPGVSAQLGPDTTPDHTSRVALQLALVTGLAVVAVIGVALVAGIYSRRGVGQGGRR